MDTELENKVKIFIEANNSKHVWQIKTELIKLIEEISVLSKQQTTVFLNKLNSGVP